MSDQRLSDEARAERNRREGVCLECGQPASLGDIEHHRSHGHWPHFAARPGSGIARVDEYIREHPVAEREAARRERHLGRAERIEGWADSRRREAEARFGRAHELGEMMQGEPIHVGHHSEGRHRRDIARLDTAMHKGIEASRLAEHHERRAAGIEAFEERRVTGPVTQRRIERLEVELRDIARRLEGRPDIHTGEDGKRHIVMVRPEGEWLERLHSRQAELEEEIAYWKAELAKLTEGGGYRAWGPADFQKGDIADTDLGPMKVIRVNAKTLTVPSIVGGSWTDTIPYDKVKGNLSRERAEQVRRDEEPAAPAEAGEGEEESPEQPEEAVE